MKFLLALLLLFAMIVILTFLSAASISDAVKNFKRGKYLSFGTNITTAILFMAVALKILFKL
jgi:threonine/homoserine/homoserine lactone efflux protein